MMLSHLGKRDSGACSKKVICLTENSMVTSSCFHQQMTLLASTFRTNLHDLFSESEAAIRFKMEKLMLVEAVHQTVSGGRSLVSHLHFLCR